MKKMIAQGAEAVLYLENNRIVKERIKKNYRISYIDKVLRKQRTKREAKIMGKVNFSPKVLSVDEKNMKIFMEFIEGELVKNILDSLSSEKRKKLCEEIGERIAELHDKNIIHGDLTTSNMIFNKKLYFIDFGLSFVSVRDEDKAVDLHLLRQGLESRHWKHYEECYKFVLRGYRKYKDYEKIMSRLKKVGMRGRYKGKNE